MSFEDDVERLEAIAAELEGEGVPLDRALKLFEEGVKRLRRASIELGRAESQLEQLVEQVNGTFALRPLPESGPPNLADGGGAGRR